MIQRKCLVAALFTLCLVFLGCPALFPKPPFDTTGSYTGTWSGTPTKSSAGKIDCPITLDLEQNFDASFPEDRLVNGVVHIDYSCLDVPGFITLPSSDVPVSGVLSKNGDLVLASGECGTAACVALVLTGPGLDTDEDGLMESFSGDWGFAILLAGVEAIGVDGTFEVQRNP